MTENNTNTELQTLVYWLLIKSFNSCVIVSSTPIDFYHLSCLYICDAGQSYFELKEHHCQLSHDSNWLQIVTRMRVNLMIGTLTSQYSTMFVNCCIIILPDKQLQDSVIQNAKSTNPTMMIGQSMVEFVKGSYRSLCLNCCNFFTVHYRCYTRQNGLDISFFISFANHETYTQTYLIITKSTATGRYEYSTWMKNIFHPIYEYVKLPRLGIETLINFANDASYSQSTVNFYTKLIWYPLCIKICILLEICWQSSLPSVP